MPAEAPNWTAFYDRVQKHTGLDLRMYKQEQMQRRILSIVEHKSLPNLEALGRRVENDPAELRWLLDKLAINVSELFRNPERWEDLQRWVLPNLLQQSPRLKCWSAGCSYGAEAYTLASILANAFPGAHSILGTDIDEAALEQARRGEFNENDVRGVPVAIRNRYFEARNGNWYARPELGRTLTFRRGNLLADPFGTGFDLILCRNVVIYFTEPAKQELYKRFFAALKPGGVLFVGSTERISTSRDIGYESPLPFFYQRPLEAPQRWRNAS